MGLKIKDYKDDPEKMKKIKSICKELNIEADENLEVQDILKAMNDGYTRMKLKGQDLAAEMNRRRESKSPKTTSKNDDLSVEGQKLAELINEKIKDKDENSSNDDDRPKTETQRLAELINSKRK